MASLYSASDSLKALCKSSLSLPEAASAAVKLSRHKIEMAAKQQADSELRSCNILIRGLRFTDSDPLPLAQNILSCLSGILPSISVAKAHWFYNKSPDATRPLSVTLASASQRNLVLQSRRLIKDSFPDITLHPDLPPHLRNTNRYSPPSQPIKSLSIVIDRKMNHPPSLQKLNTTPLPQPSTSRPVIGSTPPPSPQPSTSRPVNGPNLRLPPQPATPRPVNGPNPLPPLQPSTSRPVNGQNPLPHTGRPKPLNRCSLPTSSPPVNTRLQRSSSFPSILVHPQRPSPKTTKRPIPRKNVQKRQPRLNPHFKCLLDLPSVPAVQKS